ncbi:MAG: hypothetical protein ACL93V_08700 [Candidatus Electrothrix sp. YB6]
MVKKIFFTIGTAAIFLLPSAAMSHERGNLFDQFNNADVAAFQGVFLDQAMTVTSSNDTNSVQGLNVIKGFAAGGKVVQKAIVDADLSFDMSGGNDAVQGINVYQGHLRRGKISQLAIVDGKVTMASSGNDGGIQGINVITGPQCN